MRFKSSGSLIVAALVAAASMAVVAAPRAAVAQDGAEVLRGRVVGPDGKPLVGASVTVTAIQSKLERTTKTNGDGVYTVLFTQPEGQYVVTVRSVGLAPKKLRAIATGQGSVIVTDFAMTPAHPKNELEEVTVKGKGSGRDDDDKSVGGDERDLTDGALFSLDPSDLSTYMSNIPGVVYTPGVNGQPGSYSVLGAGEDENSLMVDGLNSDAARVPSSAIQSVTMATTTFDASRGGFSGGQMSVRTKAGTNVRRGLFTGSFTNPSMMWKDPSFPSMPKTDADASMFASGPVLKNKLFYMVSYQINRTSQDRLSITNLRKVDREQYGYIPDTITAVTSALQGLGVPLSAPGVSNQTGSTAHSMLARFDMNPTATTAMSVTMMGNWTSSDAITGPSGYASLGSGSSNSSSSVALSASTFKGHILNELHSGLSFSRTSTAPYLSLPAGSVLISSEATDGRLGVTSIQFGGGQGGTRTRATTWQTSNATSFLTSDSRHRVKLAGDISVNHNQTSPIGDRFGSYQYQSLSDLASNIPTSYSRTISSHDQSTSAVSGSVSLGDEWQFSKTLQFQYGMRVDMARSGTRPGYNPVVDTVFGRRTDDVPSAIGLSPRFGFQWRRGGASVLGPAISMQGMRGARTLTGESAVSQLTISGGIGAFRDAMNPSTIAQLVDQTGLPNTVRQLTCVGAAVPVPDWHAFAADASSTPDQCLDGTAPVEFSNDKPSVRLYDPNFHTPLSWRANLDFGGMRAKGWDVGISTNLSFGYYGQSDVDLNLRRTTMFTLPDEANRPVYVPTSAIVPTSGAVAPGASRLSDRFGTVSNTLSDLRNVASTVSWTFNRTHPFFDLIPLNVSYTWSYNRQQFRGQSVAFDPFAREWASGQLPTHAFMFSSFFNIKFVSITAFVTLNSGSRYTPGVVGDVNGDGMSNDRAFIFNPATAADPVLASQMSQLLSGTTSLARKCLQASLGQLAGLNSCRTGWQLAPNINFGLIDPRKGLSFNDRIKVNLETRNVLSAVARVVGLDNTILTKQPIPPDQTLLYVDGFDPTTQRFKYRVNQQFGTAPKYNTRGQTFQPFQVILRASAEVGGEARRPFVQVLGLVPLRRDSVLSAAELHDRLRRLASNPIDPILAMRDSLLLTEKQVADIQQANNAFLIRFDSLMKPVAEYVEEKGQKAEDRELFKRVGKAQAQVQAAMIDAIERVNETLNDDQRSKLPAHIQTLLSVRTHG